MYTINKPNKTTVEIKFSANKDEWEKAVEAVYEKTKANYNIQGFRRGQAPRKLIEKTYGEGVFFEDAFTNLAEEAYASALKADVNINPVSEPQIKLEKFVEGKLDGMIILTVIPEVKLGKYKGLNIEAELAEFTEDMLNHELDEAREHYTIANEVKDRKAEMGDIVVLDFLGTLDGVAFDGGKAEDYELKLGSKSFIDTFEEQLAGHKAGEHVTVKVKFPENYNAPTLAGKDAVFECDIKAVKVPEVPELNDEFAKTMGDFENIEAYKKDVEDQIKHELLHRNEQIMEDAILDAIVDGSEIELPSVVVEEQLDAVMKDLGYRLQYQGMQIEDYANYIGKSMQELKEMHRKDAEKIAKTKQVLEALVKAEKLSVNEKEINEKLEEFAKISNKTLEDYKKTLEQRRLDYIYSDILMGKVMGLLKENNKVTPKVKESKKVKSNTQKDTAKTSEATKKAPAKKATTKTTKEAEKSTAKTAKSTVKKTAK